MANKLVFPIEFDVQGGVKKAEKETLLFMRKLHSIVNDKPIAITTQINAGKNLLAFKAAFKSNINEIRADISALEARWNSMSFDEKYYKSSGRLKKEAKDLIDQYRQARLALDTFGQSLGQVSAKQDKNANSTRKASEAMREQTTYVERLIKRLAVYASFAAIARFLNNVREVTAQFELQRVALGAIIQDQERANEIFEEIKAFAVQSPVKLFDLTKYTKQLAAYRVETDKLFDTTKRLADVSVGLGVDMERLIMAYGKTKSTHVLNAMELRQFGMMGIPMLELVAEKLSEIRGRTVSASEAFEMIRKRMVGFNVVEQIFEDMTNKGGIFYNMQIKQGNTLYGMWQKLGDAATIMYDQIGNTKVVNDAMRGAIDSLRTLMLNWKTTARVLDVLAVTIGIYAIGVKSASIASKALALDEARLLVIEKARTINTPKLVAAIIGQNAATKLSTILTKAHTAAMTRQYMATNILSKGFWSLTAAMLANPWVAVAAAIGGIAAAIIHFSGNVETAEERVNKLNKSVTDFNNLKADTEDLIDTYNELINKTERTAQEEKKLSAVTKELANRYPGAIQAVGDFGNEVELAADKLNKLYQAEQGARMDNIRNELDKTETRIAQTKDRILELQEQLLKGTERIATGERINARTGVVTLTYEDVAMSDQTKSRILSQIDELNADLQKLETSATNAKRALGLIPSEVEGNIEQFGAWKKTLSTFKKDVDGIKIQLFDPDTLDNFNFLEEALKKVAEKYKENIALVKVYDDVLKSTNLTSEERAKIEQERAEADAMATLAKEALDYYNILATAFDKGNRSGDKRLSILKEMASDLQKINKEYEDLIKKESSAQALADTQRIYADTLNRMQELAKKYKFELPKFEVPTDTKSLTAYLEAIKKAMAKLPKSDKDVLGLTETIGKINVDEVAKTLDRKLKQLQDRVSATKTAKEFFEKILDITGDYSIATELSIDLYGDTGEGVQKQLAQQLRAMFGQYDIYVPVNVIGNADQINYQELRKFINANRNGLGDMAKELDKIADEGLKSESKFIEQLMKDLQKVQTYADKRIKLERDTQRQIAEVRAKGWPQERKDEFIAGLNEKQAKEAAKLEYEAFKDTPMYVQMFENLDNASTFMLNNMLNMLEKLEGRWSRSLNPTQLKEMAKRMAEIRKQLADRNPFKAIGEGLRTTRELTKEYGKLADIQKKFADLTSTRVAQNAELSDALAAEKLAKERYDQLLKDGKFLTDAEVQNAKSVWDLERAKVKQIAKRLNLTDEELKLLEKILGKFKDAKDETEQGILALKKYTQSISEAWGATREMVVEWSKLGNNELWGAINDGIDKFIQGAETGIEAAAGFATGDYFTGITKGISAISQIVTGIGKLFWGSKVAKANAEIERQQKSIDSLAYSYARLEKAMESALGGDYISNYRQQIANLQAQQAAYLKQHDAEMSKGKKADEEKMKEYSDAARDVADQIKDMYKQLTEQFLGTDATSAARDIANSWLDAKLSMEDSFAAISDSFKDMIKTFIVESVAAQVVKNILDPLFDAVNTKLQAGDMYGAMDYLFANMDTFMTTAEQGLELLYSGLESKYGSLVDLLGQAEEAEFTGIARDIATASEESINGLAAAINTQNYYISHVPQIAADVAIIRQYLSGEANPLGEGVTVTDLVTMQNTYLQHLPAIAANTAATAERCERAATACEEIAAQLGRVIVPRGTTATRAVATQL